MSKNKREKNLQELKNCVKFLDFALNQESTDPEVSKTVEKVKKLRNKINNIEETIPIGDIHGDPLLFLSWMILSGVATIDQDNPIIQYKTSGKDADGNEITVDVFNLRPNPDYKGKLIFLGDYIDRGPCSESIFFSLTNFLKLQKEQGRTNVTALLGNHETNLFCNGKSYKENPNIANELRNNIPLFKLCHIDGDNIYSHTNMFSDKVDLANSNGAKGSIDEFIFKRLKTSLACSRIEFIKQKDRIIINNPDGENLDIFNSILSFYKKKNPTKDEIKAFNENVNELLNIYKSETTSKDIKKIATIFISSLSFTRAINKGQAAFLDNTDMILYKGHDIDGASGDHVKNMDIGGSAWVKDRSKTLFYLGENKGIVSLRRKEVRQIINLKRSMEFYKKKLDKSNLRLTELEYRLGCIEGHFIGFKKFFQKVQILVEKTRNKYYRDKTSELVKEKSSETTIHRQQVGNNL